MYILRSDLGEEQVDSAIAKYQTLIQEQGAWKTNGFQTLLEVPRPPEQIEPVVAPRPGHMALVLAAGVANGAVIQTEDYGQVAIRGKTQHVEQIARVEIEAAPGDPERQVKKTTIRLKPTTTLTLLAQDGTVVGEAGKPLPDGDILGMNWYVKGIDDQLPQ